MKEIEALPIEIDNYTIYVTEMKLVDGGVKVSILPDPSLPDYFDDVFIGKVIHDIMVSRYENDSRN